MPLKNSSVGERSFGLTNITISANGPEICGFVGSAFSRVQHDSVHPAAVSILGVFSYIATIDEACQRKDARKKTLVTPGSFCKGLAWLAKALFVRPSLRALGSSTHGLTILPPSPGLRARSGESERNCNT